MPSRIAPADFRDYIRRNFALEGGHELKDYHIRGLEKAMRGHAKFQTGYHAPGLAALRYGKKAGPLSEQRAFSLTKNLRDAVQKGEIELDGKKLEIAHGFKSVTGMGELRKSVRGIAEEAARRAAPAEPTKEEVQQQKIVAARHRAIADEIIQRNKLATELPKTAAMTSVFDATAKSAPEKAHPDTSISHNIPRAVSIEETTRQTQTSVGQQVDPRPGLADAGTPAVGEPAAPVNETIAPDTTPDEGTSPEESESQPPEPDVHTEEPPPPADDELPI